MKKLNDDKYQELLKSVTPEYDKSFLWQEINSQLPKPERPKRRFLWLFLLGILIVGGVTGGMAVYSNGNANRSEQVSISKDVNHDSGKESSKSDIAGLQNNVSDSDLLGQESSVMSDGQSLANKKKNHTGVLDSRYKVIVDQSSIVPEPTANSNSDVETNNSRLGRYISKSPLEFDELFSGNASERSKQETLPKSVIKKINTADGRLATPSLPTLSCSGLLVANSELNFNLRPIKTLPILVSRNRPNLYVSFGGGTLSRILSSSNDLLGDYIERKAKTEEMLATAAANIGIHVALYNNFYGVAGLQYEMRTERYQDKIYERTDENIVQSDSATYFTFIDGSRSYQSGEIVENTDIFREIQNYNRLHSLGIVLGAGYQKQLGRIALFVEATAIYSPLHWRTGKAINQNLNVQDYSLQLNTFTSSRLAASGAMGIQYQLSDRWLLRSQVNYQTDLTSSFRDTNLDMKYRSLNGSLGLVLRL